MCINKEISLPVIVLNRSPENTRFLWFFDFIFDVVTHVLLKPEKSMRLNDMWTCPYVSLHSKELKNKMTLPLLHSTRRKVVESKKRCRAPPPLSSRKERHTVLFHKAPCVVKWTNKTGNKHLLAKKPTGNMRFLKTEEDGSHLLWNEMRSFFSWFLQQDIFKTSWFKLNI